MTPGPVERSELLKLDLDHEIARMARQRGRNKFRAFAVRLFTVGASSTTTILIGLKLDGVAGEVLTGAALILSATATAAVAVDAFYDSRGQWVIEVTQMARAEAIRRRLADLMLRSETVTHEDIDALRNDYEALMETHLAAWTALRQHGARTPVPVHSRD